MHRLRRPELSGVPPLAGEDPDVIDANGVERSGF
jgi:hypothetical protein